MSGFNLADALERARERFGSRERQSRADRGRGRLHPAVAEKLDELLSTREQPSITSVHRELARFCRQAGHPRPARSSIYNAIERATPPGANFAELPCEVQQALYNLVDSTSSTAPAAPREVPGDQVVFYAFNYGCPRAVSFASGLDWLSLHHASRRRGWRPKSRALLDAVLRYRGIR